MPFDTVIPGGRKISKKSKPVVKSHTTWALLNVIFVSSRIKADIYVCNVNELSLRLAAPWLVMSLSVRPLSDDMHILGLDKDHNQYVKYAPSNCQKSPPNAIIIFKTFTSYKCIYSWLQGSEKSCWFVSEL